MTTGPEPQDLLVLHGNSLADLAGESCLFFAARIYALVQDGW